MAKKPHKILLVDDEENVRIPFGKLITQSGNIPILMSSAEEAINYLRSETDGIPNYRSLAMIISDFEMEGGESGDKVLLARNQLDIDIPFYIFSGRMSTTDSFKTSGMEATGLIEKPLSATVFLNVLENTLVDKIEFDKPVIVHKIGGSSYDFDEETDHPGLVEAIRYYLELQKDYQV